MGKVQRTVGGIAIELLEVNMKQVPLATERTKSRRAGGGRVRTNPVCSTVFDGAYTDDQIEFLRAMDRYKREMNRPFPAWTEVLEVLLSLGYRKVASANP